jgi:hypothetical protein
VLWLHCECGGCCHHFDVGLQGTSCPSAEGLHELTRIVLWLHCECGGCCHHCDMGLQGTSCPLAEGYRECQGLCCGCTVNVVVAVIILIWGVRYKLSSGRRVL